uniref:Ribonuclease PH (Rph) n=1 Tax=uncultured marine group II/III euryarchaeote AD1000_35_F01 TaxID=1457758 RepID=A0A075FP46_9EURY|nr:Ribonuclease PH (rph) [uncultured marine group II/III euryarchaeote AD1000_35_F01]
MIHAGLTARRAMAKPKSGAVDNERDAGEMREVEVALDFTPNALASLVYRQGDTIVLACATKADRLPRWFPRDSGRGWVHAEYALLPGSTNSRFRRERNGAKGRTQEIERLVARSLRGAVDLDELGPIALTVDCDVLNADGGTRCASVTAASLALRLAVRRLIASGECLPKDRRLSREDVKKGIEAPELSEDEKSAHELAVMPNDVAALSVGMVAGEVKTDLDYILDSNADVDMNVVMTSDGGFVEVQGTGEEATYTREELDAMIDAATTGISELHVFQDSVLAEAS